MAVCTICGLTYEGDHCPQCKSLVDQTTTTFAPVSGPSTVVEAPSAIPVSGKTTKRAALRVIKGPQIGDDFLLRPTETTIGRNPKADIFLNDRTVSREQARIVHLGDVYILSDLGSLNGTYINKKLVDEAELLHGDVVQFGTFQMQFHQD